MQRNTLRVAVLTAAGISICKFRLGSAILALCICGRSAFRGSDTDIEAADAVRILQFWWRHKQAMRRLGITMPKRSTNIAGQPSQALYPEACTMDFEPCALNVKPCTLNPKPCEPWTLNPWVCNASTFLQLTRRPIHGRRAALSGRKTAICAGRAANFGSNADIHGGDAVAFLSALAPNRSTSITMRARTRAPDDPGVSSPERSARVWLSVSCRCVCMRAWFAALGIKDRSRAL
eukprot:2958853-Rhodomonas_salina.2